MTQQIDLHQRCLAAIAKRRELSAAATKPERVQMNTLVDAEFIAAALNSFDADTAALASIIERHAVELDTDRCSWCWDGPERRPERHESWFPCADYLDAAKALGVEVEQP